MSNPSHREQHLARGRLLVAVAIAAMLGFSMFVVALTLRAGTFGVTQAVRLSLTALLAYVLWQGRPWARKLTVVLAAITAVLFGIMAAEQAVDAEGARSEAIAKTRVPSRRMAIRPATG